MSSLHKTAMYVCRSSATVSCVRLTQHPAVAGVFSGAPASRRAPGDSRHGTPRWPRRMSWVVRAGPGAGPRAGRGPPRSTPKSLGTLAGRAAGSAAQQSGCAHRISQIYGTPVSDGGTNKRTPRRTTGCTPGHRGQLRCRARTRDTAHTEHVHERGCALKPAPFVLRHRHSVPANRSTPRLQPSRHRMHPRARQPA